MASGDKNSYFEKRKINCIERAEAIIDELPNFCREFFISVMFFSRRTGFFIFR